MSQRPADLILADADVWTGDATRRWAQAVAVRADRIVAVGTDGDVRPFKGPTTEVVSLSGRMVDARASRTPTSTRRSARATSST